MKINQSINLTANVLRIITVAKIYGTGRIKRICPSPGQRDDATEYHGIQVSRSVSAAAVQAYEDQLRHTRDGFRH
jgi:hypothetical protein